MCTHGLYQLLRRLLAIALEAGTTQGPFGHPLQLTGDTHLAVPAAFQDTHGLISLMDQK